ncbi:hypothetical protein [Dictyobacter aurantiacus]|uniref:Uncharacterized protein n=1 Tax=Dictyobacter aurantiacus TaxID=1936993 RepID=A0A401ZIB9_9CHLR|nr:hypothetical protein [Dictyobacter aurantiacus]GCE06587.1 hypothetical protein KDAU_39160 [Dictyobacter aurantiacus]
MGAHHEQEYTRNRSEQVDELNSEARDKGTTPEKIQKQSSAISSDEAVPGQKPDHRLVDGYAMTQGGETAQPRRNETEGYDPTHSGVRRPPNKPGAPTETPGRDEGTAWSSQEQMGSLKDTYDEKNPAE